MIPSLLAASPLQYVFGILLFASSLFLVLLVLVQRGRGGGLAGAFGGMGGQSAFGTKAGDVFTRVTIGVAAVWLLLCIMTIVLLNRQTTAPLGTPDDTPAAVGTGEQPADGQPADGQPAGEVPGGGASEEGGAATGESGAAAGESGGAAGTTVPGASTNP